MSQDLIIGMAGAGGDGIIFAPTYTDLARARHEDLARFLRSESWRDSLFGDTYDRPTG